MEERLARYRADKAKQTTVKPSAQTAKSRSNFFSDFYSGFCRRFAGIFTISQPDESSQTSEANAATNKEYTTQDYILLVLKFALWFILFGLFVELEFGAVYFIVSMSLLIYHSMKSGSRKRNEISAYSVFNPNCERIDGTFTTEQFEKELRYGAGSVH